MNGNIVDVGVDGRLYRAGRTEDGEDFIAESYFVCVEIEGGKVYAHEQSFPGCRVETDEEGFPYFIDIREESKARAERLCERVRAKLTQGGSLDVSRWHFHRTVYGTGAYLDEVAMMTSRQRADEPE